jgi:hypothetical protein
MRQRVPMKILPKFERYSHFEVQARVGADIAFKRGGVDGK